MTDKQLNVYQKLALARKRFLETNPKKTGWNKHSEFAYYQLEDIVPEQTKIFDELGLVEVFTFEPEADIQLGDNLEKKRPALAISKVINVDNPTEIIEFRNYWIEMVGNKAQNPLQVYGAAQTYLRRYNKMQILDIVEADEIDGGSSDKGYEKKKGTPPASNLERKELKKTIANGSNTADDVMISQIKNAMSVLKKEFGEHPKYKEWVAKAPSPKDLTSLTQTQAIEFLHEAATLREELGKEK